MVILIGMLFILAATAYWKRIPYSYSRPLLFALSTVFLIAIELSLLFRLGTQSQRFENYYESIEGQIISLVWCFVTLELLWNSKTMSRVFSAIMTLILLKLVNYLSAELYIPDDLILMLKPNWLDLSNNIMLACYGILFFGSCASSLLFIYTVVFILKEPIAKTDEKKFNRISISQLVAVLVQYAIRSRKKKIEDELAAKILLVENMDETEIEEKLKNPSEENEEKEADFFDRVSIPEFKIITNTAKIIAKSERRVQILDRISSRAILIGHISLTLAIIMGAIGAKETFGIYWFWNAKEVWSLAIWIMFTLYLHFWFIRKATPFQKAGVGFIGLGVIWTSSFYISSFLVS